MPIKDGGDSHIVRKEFTLSCIALTQTLVIGPVVVGGLGVVMSEGCTISNMFYIAWKKELAKIQISVPMFHLWADYHG